MIYYEDIYKNEMTCNIQQKKKMFHHEDGGHMFLRNVCNHLLSKRRHTAENHNHSVHTVRRSKSKLLTQLLIQASQGSLH